MIEEEKMLNIKQTSIQYNYVNIVAHPKSNNNLNHTKQFQLRLDTFKKIFSFFLVLFVLALAQEPAYQYLDSERPEMAGFPAPGLRMKAFGEGFIGIISDLETDVLYYPSLLPFLESNQIRIVFSPDKWDERGTASLNLMFPRTFIPRVGLGFQNQLRFYNPKPEFYYSDFSGYDPYSNYYSYLSSNNFGAYQQSIFLSFSINQSFIFAPFYTFVKSPYNEERISYAKHNYDTLNYSRSQYSDRINDDITENEFGLSLALKMKENLLHIAASVKNGKNQIEGKNEDQLSDFYSHEYFNEYDSFYSYNFYQDSIHELRSWSEDKTGKGKEQNLKIRWQNEARGKFNLIMDMRKISTDLEGQVGDTSYSNRWSYYFRRWRYNQNPESTETDYDSSLEYYRNLSEASGKMEDLEISLAGGDEFSLDKSINSFVGLKSVISFAKDNIYNINEEISGTDTTSQTDSSRSFLTMKVNAINLSLPIGFEYQITKPIFIRAGCALKFTYKKIEFKDEERDYPVSSGISIGFGSSFGLGFIINPRFSIDLYNNSNLFSLGEWLVQGRYRF